MVTTYTDLIQRTPHSPEAMKNATKWLQEQATLVRSVRQPENLIAKTPDRLTTKVVIGRMYLFMYDPKTKADLPYYDRLPLIFPFAKANDGFYGINLHYLPPLLRARLMDALHQLANNQRYDDTTKLRLSYQILANAAKFKYFKPCVKHYLNNHVRSRFLWVPASNWNTVLFLPIDRFVKARREKVWRDSQRMVQSWDY
jgi:hypothetical protein